MKPEDGGINHSPLATTLENKSKKWQVRIIVRVILKTCSVVKKVNHYRTL